LLSKTQVVLLHRGAKGRGRRGGKKANPRGLDPGAARTGAASDDVGAGEDEGPIDLEAIKRAALSKMHGFAGDGGGEGEEGEVAAGGGGFQGGRFRGAPPAAATPRNPPPAHAPAAAAGGGGGDAPDPRAEAKKARALRFASDSQPTVPAQQSSATAMMMTTRTVEEHAAAAVFAAGASGEDGPVTSHIIGSCELMCPPAERDLRWGCTS
jgi:hypothetical protein